MKLITLLFALAFFASCSTMSYIQADQALHVTAIQAKGDTGYYVMAYGLDQNRHKMWVQLETKDKYTVGDVINFTGEAEIVKR